MGQLESPRDPSIAQSQEKQFVKKKRKKKKRDIIPIRGRVCVELGISTKFWATNDV